MTISQTAGCAFAIAGQEVMTTILEAEALTWVNVTPVTGFGEIGGEAAALSAIPVDVPYHIKRKGSQNLGTVELTVARDPADAGQQALKAAADDTSPLPYNLKLSYNDPVTAGTGTPTIAYLKGVVLSAVDRLNGADTIIETVFRIDVDGNGSVGILTDPAT